MCRYRYCYNLFMSYHNMHDKTNIIYMQEAHVHSILFDKINTDNGNN